MEQNIFDRRFIDVESNGDVEVKISSSRDQSKEDDILHVINVELPADLPQNLNGNGSDLDIVAISYKTDKLFVRSKEIPSKCKSFVFAVQFQLPESYPGFKFASVSFKFDSVLSRHLFVQN